mgnify:CR=1 FL=1
MSSKTFKELVKHIFNSTQLLYIFSSSQLILLYFTLFYTCYRMNLYTLILLLLLMTKTLFLFPVKKIMLKSKLGKRPKGAFNCNQYNCGGVPLSGGFPSGHMLALGIIFMVIFLCLVVSFGVVKGFFVDFSTSSLTGITLSISFNFTSYKKWDF